MIQSKKDSRQKTRYAIRKKISGTHERPRLAVFRSNKQIYAQLIDDVSGKTLVTASSSEKAIAPKSNKPVAKTELSSMVGKELATRAKKKKISKVVFDRNGFLYHGRVKAFADGAREGGLKF